MITDSRNGKKIYRIRDGEIRTYKIIKRGWCPVSLYFYLEIIDVKTKAINIISPETMGYYSKKKECK